MFDMSWGEIMVIGGVALIVIGPKDLPKALRTVGQMTAKVRRLAGEFQSQFSEAMREAELQDVKKEMEGLQRDVSAASSTTFNPIQTIRDELKGAVDGKPVTPDAATDWRSADPLPPLTEPPGTPPVDPSTLNPDLANPEVQPLVPLAADEPPLPALPRTEPASASVGGTPRPEGPAQDQPLPAPHAPQSLTDDRNPSLRHAEERPEAASRSTHDGGASFETPAARAPQDDEGRSFQSGSQDEAGRPRPSLAPANDQSGPAEAPPPSRRAEAAP